MYRDIRNENVRTRLQQTGTICEKIHGERLRQFEHVKRIKRWKELYIGYQLKCCIVV